MTTYSQRYATADSNTAGNFVFHTNAAGDDIPVTKIVFGADAADPTVVTASVGFPVVLLAGTAAIGKLAANSGVVIGAVEIAAAQSIAATQSGTWTVGISGTVAISAASLPLPSGAATSANQSTANTSLASIDGKTPALGQALAAASVPVVLTAAQLSTLTPLSSVSVSSSALPTGASTSANQSTIISSLSSIDGHVDGVEGSLTSIDAKITAVNTGAVVVASSALPTGAATAARQDTGNTSLTSIDSKTPALGQALAAASVPVVLTAAQLSTLTPLSTVAATQSGTWTVGISSAQTLATVTTVSTVTNLSQMGGAAIAMGTGTRSAGTQRVTIATDDIVPASQSGTWTVQPGNTANTTAWLVSERPATSGGLTMYTLTSAASTNATSVKGSAGQVYEYECFNLNASPRYLKFYDKATSPTVGSDTIVRKVLIPGNTAGAGVVKGILTGLQFSSGIAIALTTGIGDSDTGAVAASEVIVNLGYK